MTKITKLKGGGNDTDNYTALHELFTSLYREHETLSYKRYGPQYVKEFIFNEKQFFENLERIIDSKVNIDLQTYQAAANNTGLNRIYESDKYVLDFAKVFMMVVLLNDVDIIEQYRSVQSGMNRMSYPWSSIYSILKKLYKLFLLKLNHISLILVNTCLMRIFIMTDGSQFLPLNFTIENLEAGIKRGLIRIQYSEKILTSIVKWAVYRNDDICNFISSNYLDSKDSKDSIRIRSILLNMQSAINGSNKAELEQLFRENTTIVDEILRRQTFFKQILGNLRRFSELKSNNSDFRWFNRFTKRQLAYMSNLQRKQYYTNNLRGGGTKFEDFNEYYKKLMDSVSVNQKKGWFGTQFNKLRTNPRLEGFISCLARILREFTENTNSSVTLGALSFLERKDKFMEILKKTQEVYGTYEPLVKKLREGTSELAINLQRTIPTKIHSYLTYILDNYGKSIKNLVRYDIDKPIDPNIEILYTDFINILDTVSGYNFVVNSQNIRVSQANFIKFYREWKEVMAKQFENLQKQKIPSHQIGKQIENLQRSKNLPFDFVAPRKKIMGIRSENSNNNKNEWFARFSKEKLAYMPDSEKPFYQNREGQTREQNNLLKQRYPSNHFSATSAGKTSFFSGNG